jgi:hypothetical protein
MIEDKEEFIFIQPDLNLYLNSSGKGFTNDHKHNKYLAWSIGILILKQIFRIPFESLNRFYSDCLMSSKKQVEYILEDSILGISQIIPKDKIPKLNNFFNCNSAEDENEVSRYLQYN